MSETLQAYIYVDNQTSEKLNYTSKTLNWGKTMEGPHDIDAFTNTLGYSSQGAEGSWTGTEGSVTWTCATTKGTITAKFDDPWSGSNSASISADDTFEKHYRASVSTPQKSGSISVTVTVTPN